MLLEGIPTVGTVHHRSKMPPSVDNGSEHGLLESQNLGNGSRTLSRLLYFAFILYSLDGSVIRFLISQSLFKYFILLTELRVINVPPE